jgi:hypothetical protein
VFFLCSDEPDHADVCELSGNKCTGDASTTRLRALTNREPPRVRSFSINSAGSKAGHVVIQVKAFGINHAEL